MADWTPSPARKANPEAFKVYDAGLPCKNKNCKSYGKPHPNCRCYPGYAKGGQVEYFCSQDNPHNSDCEYYFQDGGEVPANLLPQEGDIEVPKELMPPSPQGGPVSGDEVPSDMLPGMSAAQKGLSAVEGFAKSIIPGQPWLEAHNPLILIPQGEEMATEEAQAARQKASPLATGIGEVAGVGSSLITGAGLPGAIQAGAKALIPGAKIATEIAEAIPGVFSLAEEAAPSYFSRAAPKVIQSFITNGLIQGNDEISKALLGQGDPEAPVASALINMGANGLLGAGAGAMSAVTSPKMDWVANAKIGKRITSFMTGLGQASENINPEARLDFSKISPNLDGDAYKAGQKWFDNLINPVTTGSSAAGAVYGAKEGYREKGIFGMPWGAIKGAGEGYGLGVAGMFGKKMLGKSISKYATPVIIKMMSNGTVHNGLEALNHAKSLENGADTLKNYVNSLFMAGTHPITNVDEGDKEALKEFIKNGGINQNIQQQIYDDNAPIPEYAKGGLVEVPKTSKEVAPLVSNHDPIATNFPEQNVMLQAARARVSNYLSAQQPQVHAPKLAFDDEPDDTHAKKSYDKALGVAVKPLSVLDHIHKGTLEPEHIQHLNGMYPEVTNQLKKKITEKITEAQLKGEKPSYKVRQGLSMLMGTPLSGEMTPQAIQAAQASFIPQQRQPPEGGGGKKKGSTKALSKSEQSFLTADQALEKRHQKA